MHIFRLFSFLDLQEKNIHFGFYLLYWVWWKHRPTLIKLMLQFLHILNIQIVTYSSTNSWSRLLQVSEVYQHIIFFKHTSNYRQNKVGHGRVQSIISFFSNWSDKHPNVHQQRKTTDTVKTICTSSSSTSVRNRCRVMKVLPSRNNSQPCVEKRVCWTNSSGLSLCASILSFTASCHQSANQPPKAGRWSHEQTISPTARY